MENIKDFVNGLKSALPIPPFNWRAFGSFCGHTLHLGLWTILALALFRALGH